MSSTTSSGKCSRADHVEHRRLRVRAGHDDRGEDLLTGVERDPDGVAADTSIDRTDAPVRMVAPDASALRAIAIEIAPMPPLTWPHSPFTPSISPSSWWSRL